MSSQSLLILKRLKSELILFYKNLLLILLPLLLLQVLATAPFGKEKKGEVGVERLVKESAYSAAFPLHDVS